MPGSAVLFVLRVMNGLVSILKRKTTFCTTEKFKFWIEKRNGIFLRAERGSGAILKACLQWQRSIDTPE